MKAKKTYAVLGATGKVGYAMVRKLVESGHVVRAVGRDSRKLSELKRMGAESYASSLEEVSELAKIFKEADAVFTMLPPLMTVGTEAMQDKIGETVAQAIKKSDVKYVVNMSSLGADLKSGTGVVEALYRNEQRLNKLGINVMHLRASMFMENFFWATQEIEMQGTLTSSRRKDLPISYIATEDIAMKACELMEKPSFSKNNYLELYGPEVLSGEQVAGILSKACQRPVRYVQCSYEEEEKAMSSHGFDAKIAGAMVSLNRAFNEGRLRTHQKPSPQNTGAMTLSKFASKMFSKAKAA